MALYGHVADENPIFDPNIYQGQGPLCAVRCQELILRDFGIQIPEEELKEYATEQGWYTDYGTPRSQVCNLLRKCGIEMEISRDNDINSLIRELAQGHRVMVSVDACEMASDYGSEQWVAFEAENSAMHVVLVSGVAIDENNPENSTVIITDPGEGMAYKEYKLDHFTKAWEDSRCYMASSVEAAPYQYNSMTHEMEYTDFATDQIIKDYPFHDEFSDIWNFNELDEDTDLHGMDMTDLDFSIFDQFRHNPDSTVPSHDKNVVDYPSHHFNPMDYLTDNGMEDEEDFYDELE